MAEPPTIAERIVLYRRRANLTQQRLAELAGISRTALRNLESGEHANPTVETLRGIALACGCKIRDLIPEDVSTAVA